MLLNIKFNINSYHSIIFDDKKPLANSWGRIELKLLKGMILVLSSKYSRVLRDSARCW